MLSERAMESATRLATSTAASVATLEAACAAYPATRKALLDRLARWTTPFPTYAGLPAPILLHLATAQAHQDTGFAIARASAKASASVGGPLGAMLSTTLHSTCTFDVEAAHLVRSAAFPVHLHLLELLGGVIPLIALASEITARHLCTTTVAPGAALRKLASEVKLTTSKRVPSTSKPAAASSSRPTTPRSPSPSVSFLALFTGP